VDLFDALSSMLSPDISRRRRLSPREHLAAAMAFVVLPAMDMGLIVVLHLEDPSLLCVVLPLTLGGLALVSSLLLRVSLGYAVFQSLWCAGACFLIGVCVVVLTVMTWGY
jgi:hypothetical protein